MATLTVQDMTRTGLNATYNAVSASDVFTNDGNIFIHVKNGDGSANTVAIVTTITIDSLSVTDAGGSVPAGQERFFGPFAPNWYNDANGQVTVTHSNTTSNTMAVVRL